MNKKCQPDDFHPVLDKQLILSETGSDSLPFAIYRRMFSAGKVEFAMNNPSCICGIFVKAISKKELPCLDIEKFGLSKVCKLCKDCGRE